MRTTLPVTCCVAAFLAAVLPACCAVGQKAGKLPEFAVATIRPAKPDATMSLFSMPGSGIKLENLSLHVIVREAYGLQDDQIVGEPAWMKSNRFDLEAKVDDADHDAMVKLNGSQKRQMLKPVLEDRFKLRFHHETRQISHYELVVMKTGPKFKEIPPPPAGEKPPVLSWMSGRDQIKGSVISMEQLAFLLSQQAHGAVVDKTGMTGLYAVELHWTPDDAVAAANGEAAGSAPTGPSFFTAIQEQLGLKLEPVKTPVEVMVIDHVALPTPD